jgi:hypothetical protein
MSMIDATAQENRRVQHVVADIVPDRSSSIHPIILGIGGFVAVVAVGGTVLVAEMSRTPPPVAVAEADQAGAERATAVDKDEPIIEPAKTALPPAKPDDLESRGVEGERLPHGQTGADAVPPEKSAGSPAAAPVASAGSDADQTSGDGAPKIPIVSVRPNPVTTAAGPASDPAPAAGAAPAPEASAAVPPPVEPPAAAPPAAAPPAAEAPAAEPSVVKAPVVKAPAIATRAIETGSTTGQTETPAQLPVARIVSDVRMHAGPSNGHAVVATIPRGTAVEVVNCRAWCQVIFAGRRGWVYKSFLER